MLDYYYLYALHIHLGLQQHQKEQHCHCVCTMYSHDQKDLGLQAIGHLELLTFGVCFPSCAMFVFKKIQQSSVFDFDADRCRFY